MRSSHAALLALALLLAACGGAYRARQGPVAEPGAGPSKPRAAAPRAPATGPAARGKPYPECDPRWKDPDRGRVALGFMAADCRDERGDNAVYVTRLVSVSGTPSPAQRAGLQAGDRIVRIDSCEVTSTHGLAQQLRHAPSGWVARLVLERKGRPLDLFVPTLDFPDKSALPATPQLSTAGCKAVGRPPAS
jgi:hypothetical protein